MKMFESTFNHVKIIMSTHLNKKICFHIVQTVNVMNFVQMNHVKWKRCE